MTTTPTLRGFATLSFYAADHAAAQKWYTELFGVGPYFERPGYVEFRVGDYQHEIGIIDSKYAPKGSQPGPGGAVLFWHVDDIQAMFDRLISMGATEYEPIRPLTKGFVIGSVLDPFGNILGIMYNPHYLEVLAAKK